MFEAFKEMKKGFDNINKWSAYIKENNINKSLFSMFLLRKEVEWSEITPELMEEFENLEGNILDYISIPCYLSLNETYLDVNNNLGAVLSLADGENHNFTQTSRKQVTVYTDVYVAEKGIVFRKAINEAQDLRIPWGKISDCRIDPSEPKMDGFLFLEIFVNDIAYKVEFRGFLKDSKEIDEAYQFLDYVQSHMTGVKDTGWD